MWQIGWFFRTQGTVFHLRPTWDISILSLGTISVLWYIQQIIYKSPQL